MEELNTRDVAIAGAEASLHRRLKELQKMKGAKAKTKNNPPISEPSTTTTSQAPPPDATSTQDGDWVMPVHPSRKKPNTQLAEQADAESRE